MNADGDDILASLNAVAGERRRRQADAALGAGVVAIKAFQHARFAQTYADLLASPRYGRAALFFLDDLYGPRDFTERDAQFARIVPALVRMFPNELVGTVKALGQLHALSERFDTEMAAAADGTAIDGAGYARAWRAVGQPPERERQITLLLQVGQALDRYVRNPLLRHSLRLMRGPAAAAGLGALQSFLEKGFDTFREMRGADDFLHTVSTRERALAARLFAGDDAPTPPGFPRTSPDA